MDTNKLTFMDFMEYINNTERDAYGFHRPDIFRKNDIPYTLHIYEGRKQVNFNYILGSLDEHGYTTSVLIFGLDDSYRTVANIYQADTQFGIVNYDARVTSFYADSQLSDASDILKPIACRNELFRKAGIVDCISLMEIILC